MFQLKDVNKQKRFKLFKLSTDFSMISMLYTIKYITVNVKNGYSFFGVSAVYENEASGDCIPEKHSITLRCFFVANENIE